MSTPNQIRQQAYEAFLIDQATDNANSSHPVLVDNPTPAIPRKPVLTTSFDNDFYMSGFEHARRIRATIRSSQLLAAKGR